MYLSVKNLFYIIILQFQMLLQTNLRVHLAKSENNNQED